MKHLGKPVYTLLALLLATLVLTGIAITSQAGIEGYRDAADKASLEALKRGK